MQSYLLVLLLWLNPCICAESLLLVLLGRSSTMREQLFAIYAECFVLAGVCSLAIPFLREEYESTLLINAA